MKKYTLENDIRVMCVTAKSFPQGIMEAFQTLEKADASIAGRTFFGISHGSNTGIIYRAGAKENTVGEAERFGLEEYIIKKGQYLSQTLTNFKENETIVTQTFDKLLKYPALDPKGACIEWYKNENEVMCMVRLIN